VDFVYQTSGTDYAIPAADAPVAADPTVVPHRSFFFFFINLQPLKTRSTTNYAPFALDRETGSLSDILRPSTLTPLPSDLGTFSKSEARIWPRVQVQIF